MNGGDYTESVGRVSEAEPGRVFDWLEPLPAGRRQAPEDFNWHGLARTAALPAQDARTPEAKLGWARVAVAVYEVVLRKLN